MVSIRNGLDVVVVWLGASATPQLDALQSNVTAHQSNSINLIAALLSYRGFPHYRRKQHFTLQQPPNKTPRLTLLPYLTPASMSENIPQSIPTSATNPKRPTKKPRLTPSSQHSAQIEALFANPDKPINLPSGPKPPTAAAPPEIVANVQGSSAGAGSGEFHVYKASRRREYERLRIMDEEVEREEKDAEWEANREKARAEEEEKLRRNREKREKAKARKGKKGKGDAVGVVDATEEKAEGEPAVKKRLGPAKIAVATNGAAEKDGDEEAAKGQKETSEEAGLTILEED